MKWKQVPTEWKRKIIEYEMLEAQCGLSSNNPLNKRHKNYQRFLQVVTELSKTDYVGVKSPQYGKTRERILRENKQVLKDYVRLILSDKFTINNPDHKQLITDVLDKGLSIDHITADEIMEIKREANNQAELFE